MKDIRQYITESELPILSKISEKLLAIGKDIEEIGGRNAEIYGNGDNPLLDSDTETKILDILNESDERIKKYFHSINRIKIHRDTNYRNDFAKLYIELYEFSVGTYSFYFSEIYPQKERDEFKRYGYGMGVHFDNVKNLSKDQVRRIISLLQKAIKRYRAYSKKHQSPSVEEMLPKFLEVVKKYTGKNYEAEIRNGKMNKEGGDKTYDAIVVSYKDGSYCGSIKFERNKMGQFIMTRRVPLAGESTHKINLDNYEKDIADAVEFIIS